MVDTVFLLDVDNTLLDNDRNKRARHRISMELSLGRAAAEHVEHGNPHLVAMAYVACQQRMFKGINRQCAGMRG